MSKTKQYFTMTQRMRTKGTDKEPSLWFEYHTGPDKEAVAEARSLARGTRLDAVNADTLAERVLRIMAEAHVYGLIWVQPRGND